MELGADHVVAADHGGGGSAVVDGGQQMGLIGALKAVGMDEINMGPLGDAGKKRMAGHRQFEVVPAHVGNLQACIGRPQRRHLPGDPAQPLLAAMPPALAGHQPQLFHPGVWFKNFAVGTLARRHGAVAVNLLIDTDTFKHNAIPVPGGSRTHPERHLIAMDLADRPIPFEERRILDRRQFAEFGRRVADRLAPLVPDPLLRDWWPMVVQRSTETDNLGACLAQARHQLEGRWGLSTLELPESAVCSSEPFAWFTAHLLAQLPRFRSAYNEAVAEYRRRSRIRSAAHPVPDLAADGPWLEAPFWIWTADNPSRRRLFARQAGQRDRKSTRLNSSHIPLSRMPSSA